MPFLAEDRFDVSTHDLISWAFDNAAYDLDKPVYIDAADPRRFISARQGRAIIRKLVAGFRNSGLKKGDCVVIASFNDLYYPILVQGIIAAGGVYTGTNPGYTPHELAHHIKVSKAKFVVVEPELLPPILAAEHSIPKSNIFIFDTLGQPIPDGFKPWNWLLEQGEHDWVRFNDLKTAKKTLAMLLFSSGTTGLPKAVMLSHYNLVAQSEGIFEFKSRPWEVKRLLALPFFHAATAPVTHTTPFRKGDESYIMRRFDLEAFLAGIEKYQITDLVMVPPVCVAIIMSGLHEKYSLKSIKSAACGAAPLDKGVQARLKAMLAPGAPFAQVWGMTETSCVATQLHYPEDDDTGSVGRPIPNLDIKLVDDDGKDISAYGVRGEICVRGPTVVGGYFENPEANARDWDDEGYFHTGDIVWGDSKSKKWYVVDRKKELIKVRSFQVAPPEIEGVLLSHPSIIDAAVIGVHFPHASGEPTELPRAYVVQRPGSSPLTEKDIYDFAAAKLSKYKRLDGGVKFLRLKEGGIPKTASGKILKRVLREMAEKESGAKL
ncbi:acetyl-CoA synthetase-like protein [Mytilinidion resinicola]|uniref:Acetyl-CoA synthetase-like protein n=1 Tax=Mytilinidion resinicola TaxID=574789 RepID=A0A6A6Z8S4_9PEZI|nr:acetyl-CoA synthetase-like protein [Mytilinidion resinicola]KAF2817521.1 acetyl-CoA synthetase-like protein [Mytilinidion resinicola]